MPEAAGLDARGAAAFVRKHGVVLVSARGPAPRLVEAVAGGPVRGSWWAHPDGRRIFAVLQAVTHSPEVLVCRLVDGKVTLVHRRLWPALARVVSRFPPGRLARVEEVHTQSGRHVATTTPLAGWLPADIAAKARRLKEEDALAALGPWVVAAPKPKPKPGPKSKPERGRVSARARSSR